MHAAAPSCRSDEKNRAENLMIVDLLRNDISRVSLPGSVRVPALYSVESFETVHQMTSRVTARLVPGTGLGDIFAALFPCGSITGAPKIRAMKSSPVSKRPRARSIAAPSAGPRRTGGPNSTWPSAR